MGYHVENEKMGSNSLTDEKQIDKLDMASTELRTPKLGNLAFLCLCSFHLALAVFVKFDEIRTSATSWRPTQSFSNIRLDFDIM